MNKKYKYVVSIMLVILIIPITTSLNKGQFATTRKTKNNDNIVLYNTHTEEKYSYGKDISEITNELVEKISNEGLSCSYLNVPSSTSRTKAFETSRKLIKKNVNNYNQKILLDIHSANLRVNQNSEDGIRIIVGKQNKHFKQNLNYANLLLTEFQKINNVKASIYIGELVTQNQDLSPKSLLIQIGNLNSSEENIQNCMSAISIALKNLNLDIN